MAITKLLGGLHDAEYHALLRDTEAPEFTESLDAGGNRRITIDRFPERVAITAPALGALLVAGAGTLKNERLEIQVDNGRATYRVAGRYPRYGLMIVERLEHEWRPPPAGGGA